MFNFKDGDKVVANLSLIEDGYDMIWVSSYPYFILREREDRGFFLETVERIDDERPLKTLFLYDSELKYLSPYVEGGSLPESNLSVFDLDQYEYAVVSGNLIVGKKK